MKKLSVLSGLIVSLSFVFYWCHASNDTLQKTDLIIFSYNRPLQLYALLESIDRYVSGLNELHVIYRANDERYQKAYHQVFKKFSYAHTHRQGADPRADFKPLTLRALFHSQAPYVFFAVDDIVVKDAIDLNDCIAGLEKHNAYGFYLRMGTHLSESYPVHSLQALPPFKAIEGEWCIWQLAQGQHDWGYPHTVDMTIYRKKDIEADFRSMAYQNPNQLEGSWHGRSGKIRSRQAICYKTSRMVNLPLNRVQHEYKNRAMDISPEELLKEFDKGNKIDIMPLAHIKNKAAHMEYQPTFIVR